MRLYAGCMRKSEAGDTRLGPSYASISGEYGAAMQEDAEETLVVPGAGIEPARPKAPDFKSGMSTSSIIRAHRVETA